MNNNILKPDTIGIKPGTKKKKFLQIHTFYQNYLNNFYSTNSNLLSTDFKSKINSLNNDGFSGIHMLAPYMHYAGYQGQLFIANDLISQLSWAKEHGFSSLPRENLTHFLVKAQIEYYKPDVLYLSDPILFDSKFIRSLNYRPQLILGWRAANIPKGTDWSEFDIMLSNLSSLREEALKLGVKKAYHFWPGFPLWYYEEIKNCELKYDLAFCGSWTTGQHKIRNEYLTSIANKFKNSNTKLAFHLSGELETMPSIISETNLGASFGLEMLKNIRRSLMTFDARGSIGLMSSGNAKDLAKKETGNMRIIEATGAGRLLITEAYDNLSELFTPGEDIVTYETKEELIELIEYYSNNKEEALRIAENGRKRCHKEHSMSNRVLRLAEIIEDNINLNTKSNTQIDNDKKNYELFNTDLLSLESTLTHAVTLLNQNKNTEVVNILCDSEKYLNQIPNSGLLKAVALARLGKSSNAKEILIKLNNIDPDNNTVTQLLNALQ